MGVYHRCATRAACAAAKSRTTLSQRRTDQERRQARGAHAGDPARGAAGRSPRRSASPGGSGRRGAAATRSTARRRIARPARRDAEIRDRQDPLSPDLDPAGERRDAGGPRRARAPTVQTTRSSATKAPSSRSARGAGRGSTSPDAGRPADQDARRRPARTQAAWTRDHQAWSCRGAAGSRTMKRAPRTVGSPSSSGGAGAVLGADRAAMRLDDLAGDRQAEPGILAEPLLGPVRVEALEDPLQRRARGCPAPRPRRSARPRRGPGAAPPGPSRRTGENERALSRRLLTTWPSRLSWPMIVNGASWLRRPAPRRRAGSGSPSGGAARWPPTPPWSGAAADRPAAPRRARARHRGARRRRCR